VLTVGGNVLLLDEPTNDLDVDTLRASRTGCWTSPAASSSSATTAGSSTASPRTLLAFEDEGRVVWFEGNYGRLRADRKKRLGTEAERPHRLRHKKLRTA